jgi:hypothetical protein
VPDTSSSGAGTEFVGCFVPDGSAQIVGQLGSGPSAPAGTVSIIVFCRKLTAGGVLTFSSPSLAAACHGVASIPNVTTDALGNAFVKAGGGDATHACSSGHVNIEVAEASAPFRKFEVPVELTT